eukprot:2758517-Pyramimonas_sp.AAC.1
MVTTLTTRPRGQGHFLLPPPITGWLTAPVSLIRPSPLAGGSRVVSESVSVCPALSKILLSSLFPWRRGCGTAKREKTSATTERQLAAAR